MGLLFGNKPSCFECFDTPCSCQTEEEKMAAPHIDILVKCFPDGLAFRLETQSYTSIRNMMSNWAIPTISIGYDKAVELDDVSDYILDRIVKMLTGFEVLRLPVIFRDNDTWDVVRTMK